MISWSQTQLEMGGIAPEEPSRPRVTSGAALIDPRSGRLTSVTGAATAPREPLPLAIARQFGARTPELGPFRAGSVVATAEGGHGNAVTLKRWDAHTGQLQPERTVSARAVAVLPSADERYLVASEHVPTDDLTQPQYRWSIVSLETGDRVEPLVKRLVVRHRHRTRPIDQPGRSKATL